MALRRIELLKDKIVVLIGQLFGFRVEVEVIFEVVIEFNCCFSFNARVPMSTSNQIAQDCCEKYIGRKRCSS